MSLSGPSVLRWTGRYFFLPRTASFKSFPTVNFATVVAGILISSPVAGLRPTRAFRFAVEKLPNLTSVTFPPFLSVAVTALQRESIALSAAPFEILASFDRRAIKSPLFILFAPFLMVEESRFVYQTPISLSIKFSKPSTG